MDHESPVPLWVVLTIGVVVAAVLYLFGQSHLYRSDTQSISEKPRTSPATSGSFLHASISVAPSPSIIPPPFADAISIATTTTISPPTNIGGHSSNPCYDGMKNFDGGKPTSWRTYNNPEDFYSIRYPNLGTFEARYTSRPKETILSWREAGCFTVDISYIDPNGLTLSQWLAMAGISAAETEATSINNMATVILQKPDVGLVRVFLERAMSDGSPIIYTLDFRESDYGQEPPPFWRGMLRSFSPLHIIH